MYHTLPGFGRSGLGFAADTKYEINDFPTKVFVGLYTGHVDERRDGLNAVAQIGHVWECDLRWGVHYFMFGNYGDLTGMQNGNFVETGGIINISKTDANRLIEASWDLISAQDSLAGSLEKCILSLERAKRRRSIGVVFPLVLCLSLSSNKY